ncbi:MAG: hypothetical protein IJ326_05395 [Lachnospiraceae bacterium]|nr:hypothetical protein [Lachnospiraceae bacterium]
MLGLLATETTASAIDMTVVNMLIELVKSLLTLFTVFPINIFLVAGLVGVGFGIFRKAKGAAGGK